MASSALLFPLERVTRQQLRRLCQALWSWPECDKCCTDKPCKSENCPFKRVKRLGRFFDFYKDVTATYEAPHEAGNPATLKEHEDLFRIIEILKTAPNITRSQFQQNLFGDCQGADQDCVVDIAVKIMAMVNCSADCQSTFGLQSRVYWQKEVTFTQFLNDSFPTPTDHPMLNDRDLEQGTDMKGALLAKKLKKHTRLSFQPTDDLSSHLKLDKKTGILKLYHHTAFLKEHLRLTKASAIDASTEGCLQLGILPRQLALETLDSIQKILFPITDKKSRAILVSLTTNQGFDPDCLRFESASIRKDTEKDISYHYFSARLAELYEELENPTPRGIEKWFQRKSGARYVMMATLIGVVIAIILGLAGLAVSGYQAWLGYQQWQHPISSGGS